ncbi:MAG: SDR family NAD(P)-dependent oxidoreductase [Candidatus Accumulibacter meliphilus]|jgi:3-oxoacyl-[acyl-carrier protein] reductase|uniref:SDR family NAD(P)-dependent oxidoreductase n=1 Tax=Candidatus Accumulibacter meliphilus TaxID=2211374 RepID=A0A369XPP4_9PROT|nr:MAG: SDR family NAD(P)-dependent oxidoreductase [Candidatus Accumulibacter meliphilus]
MKLAGQVALITGASGGIGSAICRALAREGASLALHYCSREANAVKLAEQLQSSKRLASQQFVPIAADLLDNAAACDLVARSVEAFGRLDIIVNNAGWTRVVQADDIEGLDNEMISKTVRMKIDVPLCLLRAARPHLEQSGAGQLINITSVAGIAAKGSSIVYAAANAALSNLTRSLARALAPKIRVNAVAPGFVETGFAWPKDGKVKAHVAQRNHIARTVEADEVAEVVRFLVCDAPAITGEEIAIDGGIGRLGVR